MKLSTLVRDQGENKPGLRQGYSPFQVRELDDPRRHGLTQGMVDGSRVLDATRQTLRMTRVGNFPCRDQGRSLGIAARFRPNRTIVRLGREPSMADTKRGKGLPPFPRLLR